jgi:hypothetical protein
MSNSNQPKRPEPNGLAGRYLPGSYCNGLFSVGSTYRGLGTVLPHPTLRTGFPIPAYGQDLKSTGSSTAHLQLFQSSTGCPALQPTPKARLTWLQRFRDYQPAGFGASSGRLWKAAETVGNRSRKLDLTTPDQTAPFNRLEACRRYGTCSRSAGPTPGLSCALRATIRSAPGRDRR